MTKWEYCQLEARRDLPQTSIEVTYHRTKMPQRQNYPPSSSNDLALESEVVELLGRDGWEAFSAEPGVRWILRRPLQERN
jgi:hypothetical protein